MPSQAEQDVRGVVLYACLVLRQEQMCLFQLCFNIRVSKRTCPSFPRKWESHNFTLCNMEVPFILCQTITEAFCI